MKVKFYKSVNKKPWKVVHRKFPLKLDPEDFILYDIKKVVIEVEEADEDWLRIDPIDT